eukprot:COSAG05_NODE_19399_length_293_cov_0.974227_1_plen_74_part_10
MVGDARLTYSRDFASDNQSIINSEPINVSTNYFLVEPRTDDPVYDLPIGILPVSPFNRSRFETSNGEIFQVNSV